MGYPFHPITQKASHPSLKIYRNLHQLHPITCPSPKTPPQTVNFPPRLKPVSNPFSQRTAPPTPRGSREPSGPHPGPLSREVGGRPRSPALCEGPQATLLEPHGHWDPRDGQIHSRSLAGTGAHLSHSAPASFPGPTAALAHARRRAPRPLSVCRRRPPRRARSPAPVRSPIRAVRPDHFRPADGGRGGALAAPPPRGAQSAPCAPLAARAEKVGSRRGRMRAAGAGAGQLAPVVASGIAGSGRGGPEPASLQVSGREAGGTGRGWVVPNSGLLQEKGGKWGKGSERSESPRAGWGTWSGGPGRGSGTRSWGGGG